MLSQHVRHYKTTHISEKCLTFYYEDKVTYSLVVKKKNEKIIDRCNLNEEENAPHSKQKKQNNKVDIHAHVLCISMRICKLLSRCSYIVTLLNCSEQKHINLSDI